MTDDTTKSRPPYEVDVGPVVRKPGHYLECSACGSKSIAAVLYGEPDADGEAMIQRGEVAAGGCIVGPDSPGFRCKACGKEFGRRQTDE